MSFHSLMWPGRLPEKPWRTDALVRLIAGIAICCLSGALVAMIIRFFGEHHRTSALPFLAFTIGAFGCFAGALTALRRPWSFETLLRKLLILLLGLYGGFFLMWLAERLIVDKGDLKSSTVSVLISILSFQGAALVLVHFLLREYHLGWAEGFGFSNGPGRALGLGVIVGLAALPITLGLQIVSSLLLQALTFQPQEQETVQILRTTEGWQNRLVLGVATIIVAPMAEEVLFRGILYPTLKRISFPQFALWVTALLFAAIHLNLASFVPLAFLAIVLIWLYEYTGNLLACIITHSLFNAANFIALYLFQN